MKEYREIINFHGWHNKQGINVLVVFSWLFQSFLINTKVSCALQHNESYIYVLTLLLNYSQIFYSAALEFSKRVLGQILSPIHSLTICDIYYLLIIRIGIKLITNYIITCGYWFFYLFEKKQIHTGCQLALLSLKFQDYLLAISIMNSSQHLSLYLTLKTFRGRFALFHNKLISTMRDLYLIW